MDSKEAEILEPNIRGKGMIPDFLREGLASFDWMKSFKNKQKIFIVEGPDGSGKSTLCDCLSKLYSLPIIHLTYFEKQEDMDKQYERVYQIIHSLINHSAETGIIFDRFVSSNRVYSQVYKNSKISPWLSKIEELILSIASYYDITFINCLPADKQNYLNRYKDLASIRDELYKEEDEIKKMAKVYDSYKEEFATERMTYRSFIKSLDYDYLKSQAVIEAKDLLGDFITSRYEQG